MRLSADNLRIGSALRPAELTDCTPGYSSRGFCRRHIAATILRASRQGVRGPCFLADGGAALSGGREVQFASCGQARPATHAGARHHDPARWPSGLGAAYCLKSHAGVCRAASISEDNCCGEAVQIRQTLQPSMARSVANRPWITRFPQALTKSGCGGAPAWMGIVSWPMKPRNWGAAEMVKKEAPLGRLPSKSLSVLFRRPGLFRQSGACGEGQAPPEL